MRLSLKICLFLLITVIAIHFVVILSNICIFIKKYFLLKQKNLALSYGKNSWVVITGGSSGQGKEFAIQLARAGFHILLIGSVRSYDVAKFIKETYNQKVIVIQKDFSESFQPSFFDEIETVIRDLDCSILINNVGYRTGWIPYHEQPPDEIRASIACGTLVQARMTHLLIPKFMKRKEQYRSSIVFITAQCMHPNLGLAVTLPNEISIPYMAVYEASNSFGYYHACSIIKEYGTQSWLDVLNITPGAVLTENTTQMLQSTPFAVKADTFVSNILRFMGGNLNGTTCAYWGHSFSNGMIAFAPFMKDIILEKVGRQIATHCMQKRMK